MQDSDTYESHEVRVRPFGLWVRPRPTRISLTRAEQYERSFEFEINKNGNERKCQLIRSNHLEVARGARGLRDGGVGGVGGVEVTLDGALRRMLDLEEALGEAFHLQVQTVERGFISAMPKLAIFPFYSGSGRRNQENALNTLTL